MDNSVIKGISDSRNSIEKLKIKSVIEEKRSTESKEQNQDLKEYSKNKCENKIVNRTQHFNISIQAVPNQDIRSLADEVIKRIREKSRDVLFDAPETFC